MLKKILAVALSCLLISVTTSAVYASSQDDKRAREIEKVKESVRKLGIGPEARVEVTLHDGKKYELDYWCDICAIPMYELKECECCQGPIRFRFRETDE